MLASATYGLTALRGHKHPPAAAAARDFEHPSRGGFSVIDGGRKHRPRRDRSGGRRSWPASRSAGAAAATRTAASDP